MPQLDTFTKAYIEAALWSSSDDNDSPLDQGDAEISVELLASMVDDCKAFQADNAELLSSWYGEASETEERAGHDFWLTRCGHGAGFWDRWSSATPQGEIGRQLTDLAHAYGNIDLYVGDDGKIYGA